MPSFTQHLDTLQRWRRYPGLERLDAAHVALTFDDGPDPDGTPAVLDALDAERIKATFFMVGEQVKAAPVPQNLVATTLPHWQVNSKAPRADTTRSSS